MIGTANEIATAVRTGATSARAIAEATIQRIERTNPQLGAFTDLTRERAFLAADIVDARLKDGTDPGPLAGVPFAVKNLFDLKGLTTRAGSLINRENAPAQTDATLVTRLEAAGAVCVGALNMGEYAYDFTGENTHDGPSRNPHALDHMSGGSSGGSGTAVAGGLVPLALGSDTNGSIRVPASLCGIFGLKPTYGRLSRAGTFPFVASLDHLGPLARSVSDLALAYDALQGQDAGDPHLANRPTDPVAHRLGDGAEDLRIAVAGGYFKQMQESAATEAVVRVAAGLSVERAVEIADAATGRGAAYLITMAEGAALHLDRLRTRPDDFDPAVRDRLLAGAIIPAAWVQKAQKVRRAYRDSLLALFETVDVIIAPATPCRAPRLGQDTMTLDGETMPVRPNLGLFTQPISCVGLPVVTVPVWTRGETLPIGVQIIAPPWREDLALRVARHLERLDVVAAPVAKGFAND
ncbi:MAG: AtzE family amidohydrolase [Pseudomonadota bacterium]